VETWRELGLPVGLTVEDNWWPPGLVQDVLLAEERKFGGQRSRASTRHWQPACPPRTWAASAVSLARAGTACTRLTETPLAPRPAPRKDAGDEALLVLARQAAAEHQDQHGQPITRDALRD
jgi:hypothetical protein